MMPDKQTQYLHKRAFGKEQSFASLTKTFFRLQKQIFIYIHIRHYGFDRQTLQKMFGRCCKIMVIEVNNVRAVFSQLIFMQRSVIKKQRIIFRSIY